jgi:Uma2 family endonuclease
VTTTLPLVYHRIESPWTVEELAELPDDGNRFEIFDGILMVSAPPAVYHVCVAGSLHVLLAPQAPPDVFVGEGAGIRISDSSSYFEPDVVVARRSAVVKGQLGFNPADVSLVVEVLSPSNRRNDLVVKRAEYAAAGIPDYWLVDHAKETLTVLRLGPRKTYRKHAEVRPGATWRTDRPFPLTLDPADLFSSSTG